MQIDKIVKTLPAFYDMQYTDKEGNLSHEASSFNDKTYQFFSEIFNVGITFPSYTNTNITDIDIANNDKILPGTVFFNATTNKLNVKTAVGTIEVIQSI